MCLAYEFLQDLPLFLPTHFMFSLSFLKNTEQNKKQYTSVSDTDMCAHTPQHTTHTYHTTESDLCWPTVWGLQPALEVGWYTTL